MNLSAESLVLRYVRSGLLDRVFGSPDDALDVAIERFGNDVLSDAERLAPEINRMGSKIAQAYDVNEDYFNFVVYRNKQSWPVRGKLAEALTVASEIVLESGRMPSLRNLILDQEESDVDAAVQTFAKWAKTYLSKSLHKMFWKQASKHAKTLIRKLDQDVTPTEMTKYLILKTSERLKHHTLMFDNSYLLDLIIHLV